MISSRFKHVCIESFAVHMPDEEVTSAQIEDKLAPIYQRLGIPFGTLEKLSGIKSRYFFPPTVKPSAVATVAAKQALEQIGFDRSHLKAVFSCSVTRDYFEPATACLVHRNLGLPEQSIALDITNACIGFSNGIMLLGNLIETGVVKAGILVSGENISRTVDSLLAHMLKDESVGREELIQMLPTFTLGCGAVAYVLCHESIATRKHKIIGWATRSASEFNDLCSGNGDFCVAQVTGFNPIMSTESSKLIDSASKLGGRVWKDFSSAFGWTKDDVDHIFCHQVGRQVNQGFYDEMALDFEKEFTIYRKFGNLISAALPTALAMGVKEKNLQPGEKVLLTAFGSGLNCIFTGIEW